MSKHFFSCVLLLCFLSVAGAQTQPGKTHQGYNDAQKRLLVKSTGRFLHMVSQGHWDEDSSISYACKVYGLNRQMPYDEMIYDRSIQREVRLLDERRPMEVAAIVEREGGEKRVRLLLELAIYYLHQPGRNAGDLKHAETFIAAARKTSSEKKWLREVDALEGELLWQRDDLKGSARYFASVTGSSMNQIVDKRKAMAWHDRGLHLPFTDSNRIRYLEKAYSDFLQLGLKEHAIGALGDIATACFVTDWKKAGIKLDELLALQKSAGYRHIMDTYYVMSYLKITGGDYLGALLDVDSCVDIMTRTGDSLLYSLACTRLGDVYRRFEENEKAFEFYMKGLERRDIDPQLFWYKNFIYLPYVIIDDAESVDNANKLMAFFNEVRTRYPPEMMADSLQIQFLMANINDRAGNKQEAERLYLGLLKAMETRQMEHMHAEAGYWVYHIGRFYFSKKDYAKSRAFIERSLQKSSKKAFTFNHRYCYYYLSRLDSIEGNYLGAYKNYQVYKMYFDSSMNVNARFKMGEMNLRFETARKDQDIKILQQQGEIHESALQRAELTRNIVLAGLGLLMLIAVLLYNQYHAKKKNAELIAQKNKALEQLVDEKQWLLKEVHHRVKNSLQTVVSLLELQTDYLRNDPMAAIQSSQNRIFATSLLHQKLYQEDNMSSVNMSVYLPELVHYLEDAFQTRGRIHLHTDIQSVELDISQAVPIGIIINEVITNAIKHAFPDESTHNEIRVSLSMESEIAALEISDNGKGLSSNEKEEGLGMKLVHGLAEDIDGTVRIVSGKGTAVFIRFKPRPALNARRYTQQEQLKQQHEEVTDR